MFVTLLTGLVPQFSATSIAVLGIAFVLIGVYTTVMGADYVLEQLRGGRRIHDGRVLSRDEYIGRMKDIKSRYRNKDWVDSDEYQEYKAFERAEFTSPRRRRNRF